VRVKLRISRIAIIGLLIAAGFFLYVVSVVDNPFFAAVNAEAAKYVKRGRHLVTSVNPRPDSERPGMVVEILTLDNQVCFRVLPGPEVHQGDVVEASIGLPQVGRTFFDKDGREVIRVTNPEVTDLQVVARAK
jgi:hypothetical protein